MATRRNKYGVTRINRANYNTNAFGQQERSHWWRISDEIRRRDNNRCIWCNAVSSEVHHIKPLSKGGLNVKTNMACICKKCHDKRHPHLHEKRSGRHASEDPF